MFVSLSLTARSGQFPKSNLNLYEWLTSSSCCILCCCVTSCFSTSACLSVCRLTSCASCRSWLSKMFRCRAHTAAMLFCVVCSSRAAKSCTSVRCNATAVCWLWFEPLVMTSFRVSTTFSSKIIKYL